MWKQNHEKLWKREPPFVRKKRKNSILSVDIDFINQNIILKTFIDSILTAVKAVLVKWLAKEKK